MAEHEHYCPFLNQTDDRCSGHFHLDHLQHAFHHCFDKYDACPVYADRLIERNFRRQVDSLRHIVEQSVLHAQENQRAVISTAERAAPLVQVSISQRLASAFRRTQTASKPAAHSKPDAADQKLPALSRV